MFKMAEKSCFTRKPRFNKNENLGFHLVILFLIGYIIQSLCRYYVSCQGHIMGAQMERDMRKDLFD